MATQLFRPFLVVYAVTFVTALIDVVFISMMPQGFRLTSQMEVAFFASVFLTFAGVFLANKEHICFAALSFSFANIYAIAPLTELAHLAPSYIGRHFPVIDDVLAGTDVWLGFDWNAYFAWHVSHASFGALCRVAYLGWPLIALGITVVLACTRDTLRLSKLLIALNLSLIAVYAIASAAPSYGAYTFHGMTSDSHANFFVQFSDFKPVYDALRQGIVDIYAEDIPRGAISFPSFHTTTVLLYCWASWKTKLRWPVVGSQVLSFLAIPVQGAHFLTDMIVGAMIGIAAIVLADTMLRLVCDRRETGARLIPAEA